MQARVRFPPSTPFVQRFRAQGVFGCTLARQVRGAGSTPAGRSTHAWPIGKRHRPSKPARRVRFSPRAQFDSAGRVGTQVGLISRTPSVRFRPLQPGSDLSAREARSDRLGRLVRSANRGREARSNAGSSPCWQTADRTSASRRSSGGTTVARCLSSVDGDVPGPYPGEDRSSRSRGSHTRVAKRQRRRLLSAPAQVRVLPLVP